MPNEGLERIFIPRDINQDCARSTRLSSVSLNSISLIYSKIYEGYFTVMLMKHYLMGSKLFNRCMEENPLKGYKILI